MPCWANDAIGRRRAEAGSPPCAHVTGCRFLVSRCAHCLPMFNRDRSSLIEGNYRNWANLAAYRAEANRFQQGLNSLEREQEGRWHFLVFGDAQ